MFLSPVVLEKIQEVRALISEPHDPTEVGQLLAEIRRQSERGGWGEVCQAIFPDLATKPARRKAERYIADYRRSPRRTLDFPAPSPAACDVDTEEYFRLLRALDNAQHGIKEGLKAAIAGKFSASGKTIERDLCAMRRSGWNKELLRDLRGAWRKGKSSLPDPLPELWRLLRSAPRSKLSLRPIAPVVSDGRVTIVDRETGEVLPFDVLEGRLYKVRRAVAQRNFVEWFPQARGFRPNVFSKLDSMISEYDRMTHQDRRLAHAGGKVINHVMQEAGCEARLGLWSFDFTQADFWVWDRKPGEAPYRPWVTAIIDILSACPAAVVLHKEPPSHYTLRSAILTGIYPKSEVWQFCGLPVALHGDNGLVQHCQWLDQLQQHYPQAFRTDAPMPLALSHSRPHSPQDNSPSESFFSQFKNDFCPGKLQMQFPQAYWGNDPAKRPEWFRPYSGQLQVNRNDEAWRNALPTLETAKELIIGWLEEMIQRKPTSRDLYDRLGGMSRAQYFQWRMTHFPAEVKIPDDPAAFARLLCDKAEGKVVRKGGIVAHGGIEYQHDELIPMQGERVNLWIDPYNVNQAIVYPDGYGYPVCIAFRAGSPLETRKALTIFEHLARIKVKRENVKRQERLKAIQQGVFPTMVAEQFDNVTAFPPATPQKVEAKEPPAVEVDAEALMREQNKILAQWG